MAEEWMTYKQAAAVLGVSPENVRHRAIRGRWPRRVGNDKRAKIQLPDNPNPARTPREPPDAPPFEQGANSQTIKALQERVEALQAELAGASGELTGVREALDEARARAGAAEMRSSELAVDLAAARSAATQAISAYTALAEPLEALAAHRAKPWWRRLAG